MRDTERGGLQRGLRGLRTVRGNTEEENLQEVFSSFIASSLSDDDSSGLEACHDGHLKNNDI